MNRLWVRLSLGFSGTVILAAFLVACTAIFLGWLGHQFSERRDRERWEQLLGQYVDTEVALAQTLAEHYQTHQNWDSSDPLLEEAQQTFTTRQYGPWRVGFVLLGADKQIIYHPQPHGKVDTIEDLAPLVIQPIQVDGETAGYVALSAMLKRPNDDDFRQEEVFTFFFMLVMALLGVTVLIGGSSALFGIAMSRSLTAPLNNLVLAAQDLGRRDLSYRVPEIGTDEMIAVAVAFNQTASNLEEAETLRRNLLADVAHEIRTPLSVLQGNLRAILDEVYPLEQEEIARLYEQSRFLSRLVNDLHELAQAEANKLPLDFQAVELSPLVETTVDTFRPRAESDQITLQTALPERTPTVHVDAGRLRQVLQNLLANAFRHTPSGGTITVGLTPQTNGVELAISDTGEGIPPEVLPHIFDRFYRTDPARSRDKGGAGLGLAIVRAIVEAHGGSIVATSEGILGKGTTFTITLPYEM